MLASRGGGLLAACSLACGPAVSTSEMAGTGGADSSGPEDPASSGSAPSSTSHGTNTTAPSTTSTGSATTSSEVSSSGGPSCACGVPELTLDWSIDFTIGREQGFADLGSSIATSGHSWALRQPLPESPQTALLLHADPQGELEFTNIAELGELGEVDVGAIVGLAASATRLAVAVDASRGQTDLHLFDTDMNSLCVVPAPMLATTTFAQADGSWLLTDSSDVVRVDECGAEPQLWPALLSPGESMLLAQMDEAGLWLLGIRDSTTSNEQHWFVRNVDTTSSTTVFDWESPVFLLPSSGRDVALDSGRAYLATASTNSSPTVRVLDVGTGALETFALAPIEDGVGPTTIALAIEGEQRWAVFEQDALEVHAIAETCCAALSTHGAFGSPSPKNAMLIDGDLVVESPGPGFAVRRFRPGA
ncbi:MAG: hypothetical protein ACRBN8_28065 [Nannocystales bacterium]